MAKSRISTTVDQDLLHRARELHSGTTDSSLIEDALRAFLAAQRTSEIDDWYRVYDQQPISQPDEWGDLESFRRAAAGS